MNENKITIVKTFVQWSETLIQICEKLHNWQNHKNRVVNSKEMIKIYIELV